MPAPVRVSSSIWLNSLTLQVGKNKKFCFSNFIFTDKEYDFACILPTVPAYLEIREDHELIKQHTEEILGKMQNKSQN